MGEQHVAVVAVVLDCVGFALLVVRSRCRRSRSSIAASVLVDISALDQGMSTDAAVGASWLSLGSASRCCKGLLRNCQEVLDDDRMPWLRGCD